MKDKPSNEAIMNLLILGATGRTGRWVLDEALTKGHRVHCLVRNKNKLDRLNSNFRVFEGTPLDLESLAEAMEGCEAVINTLNVARKSDFPWAGLRSPKNLLSLTMEHLIALSREMPLKRMVVCSAWGVAETRREIPAWFRWLIDYSNIGAAYRDHERQEELLEGSELDWTIVRAAGLTNGNKTARVRVSYNNVPKPSLTIPRRAVARFMVEALENDALIGKKPVISAD